MLSSVILWRVPFLRLVTDVALKIIIIFFFCVCVFERLFISRYKSEFLNFNLRQLTLLTFPKSTA